MKNIGLIAVSLILTAIFSIPVIAQGTSGNKVFIIDTGAFGDEKEGITKYVDGYRKLAEELKPQYTELENLTKKITEATKQYNTLNQQYQNNPKGPISAVSIQKNKDDIEKMQIEYQRKEEDLKLALGKREQELLDPVRFDIYKTMDKFAKEKGYPIILDIVKLVEIKLILAIGDNKVDLTKEFIDYYNAQK